MKVLVTEATRNASRAIIRALDHADYQVMGSDNRRLVFDAHSCYTGPYLDSAALGDAFYAESLLSIVDYTRPDVLLPGNQIEAFVREKPRFSALTHVLLPDLPAWEAAYYNDRTLASCEQLGIGCPSLLSAAEAQGYLQQHREHKVMIKPRADIGGGQGLQLVHSEAQLLQALESLDLQQYFIQEFIPGPIGNMRSVALLYDANSELQVYFTSHKLRQWPQDGGICALGQSTDEPELVEFIQPFFKHWQWQGVAEVEIKIDARDGSCKLIEINPRFWGNSNFSVQAGANFPAYLCDLALGKTVTQPQYQIGYNYISWSCYLRCIGSDLLQGNHRSTVLKNFISTLQQPRARNMDWRDWRCALAKTVLEMQDVLRA
jgi:predicted ATP-grasp superfamily ATP-dependent carboligase